MNQTRLRARVRCTLRRLAVVLALLALAPAIRAGAENASSGTAATQVVVDVGLHAFGYSDGLPLRTAYDGFEGAAPDHSEHLLSRQRFELGVSRGDWRIAVGYRNEYLARYADDTLQLLHGRHNDVPVAPGRHRLRVQANHAEGVTLGVSRRFVVGDVEAQVRLDGLRIVEFTDGRLDGALVVAPDGRLSGEARLDYHYSKDDVLERPRQAHAPGWGASLSIAAAWRPSPTWQFTLQVDDALGVVRFADAPYTRALLRLASPRLAPDGTIDSEALLSGRESVQAHWQTLPVHYDVGARYALSPRGTGYARVRGSAAIAVPELGLEWDDGRVGRWRIGWLPTAGALVLGVSSASGSGRVGIALDDVDLDEARLLETTFSGRWEVAD